MKPTTTLGFSALHVTHLGVGAMAWGDPLVLPVPGAKNNVQAMNNAGALNFRLTSAEVETLNQATLAWRI